MLRTCLGHMADTGDTSLWDTWLGRGTGTEDTWLEHMAETHIRALDTWLRHISEHMAGTCLGTCLGLHLTNAHTEL